MPSRMNVPERLVPRRHLALALEDVDLDLRLVVARGREDLALGRRDRRVPVDEPGHDAAERLDAERERRDVEEQHVLDVAREDARLDGRADGDDLVGVDALVRLLAAEHLLDGLDVRGHAGLAADEDDLVDVGGLEAGVLERRRDRLGRLVDEVGDERSSLARVSVITRCLGLRSASTVMNGRLISDCIVVDSSIFARSAASLSRWRACWSFERSMPWSLLNSLDQPVDDPLVEVVAAEVRVAVGRLDLEDAVAELEDRDVERAAAEVVDGDLLVLLLVEAVGEGRGRRLVDDALDVEARDAAGILGRLALRVVEVGRDRDDGLGDLLAEVGLRVRLELLEDHRADLGRAVLVAVRERDDDAVALGVLLDLVGHEVLGPLHLGVVPATPHEALDRVDRVGGVGDGLALGDLADEALALLAEGDDRGHRAAALGAGDDGRLAALHDGDHRVGGPEVDPDDASHVQSTPCFRPLPDPCLV